MHTSYEAETGAAGYVFMFEDSVTRKSVAEAIRSSWSCFDIVLLTGEEVLCLLF